MRRRVEVLMEPLLAISAYFYLHITPAHLNYLLLAFLFLTAGNKADQNQASQGQG